MSNNSKPATVLFTRDFHSGFLAVYFKQFVHIFFCDRTMQCNKMTYPVLHALIDKWHSETFLNVESIQFPLQSSRRDSLIGLTTELTCDMF